VRTPPFLPRKTIASPSIGRGIASRPAFAGAVSTIVRVYRQSMRRGEDEKQALRTLVEMTDNRE
jgi:hypothetical protein